MNKALLLSMFLVIPCVEALANSQVYQYRDKDGTTILSAKPSKHPDLNLIKVTNSGTGAVTPSKSNTKSSGNVSKNYKALVPVPKQYYEYLNTGQEVQLFSVSDANRSSEEFAEMGYKVIGFSRFRDYEVSYHEVRDQAQKIRATHATVQQVDLDQFKVSSGTGVQSERMKWDEIYEYLIAFYVKNNELTLPYKMGIDVEVIPTEKRSIYQRNTGAYVNTVLQGSKPYNANLLRDDVIVAINDNPILTPDDFSRIMKESVSMKSKTLNLKVLRIVNNDLKEALISFNLE